MSSQYTLTEIERTVIKQMLSTRNIETINMIYDYDAFFNDISIKISSKEDRCEKWYIQVN